MPGADGARSGHRMHFRVRAGRTAEPTRPSPRPQVGARAQEGHVQLTRLDPGKDQRFAAWPAPAPLRPLRPRPGRPACVPVARHGRRPPPEPPPAPTPRPRGQAWHQAPAITASGTRLAPERPVGQRLHFLADRPPALGQASPAPRAAEASRTVPLPRFTPSPIPCPFSIPAITRPGRTA